MNIFFNRAVYEMTPGLKPSKEKLTEDRFDNKTGGYIKFSWPSLKIDHPQPCTSQEEVAKRQVYIVYQSNQEIYEVYEYISAFNIYEMQEEPIACPSGCSNPRKFGEFNSLDEAIAKSEKFLSDYGAQHMLKFEGNQIITEVYSGEISKVYYAFKPDNQVPNIAIHPMDQNDHFLSEQFPDHFVKMPSKDKASKSGYVCLRPGNRYYEQAVNAARGCFGIQKIKVINK